MNHYDNKPKPDDRSDNAEKLQQMIHDTMENMEEAEETAKFSNEKDRQNIEEKNNRRQDAIEGFRNEIKDETNQ